MKKGKEMLEYVSEDKIRRVIAIAELHEEAGGSVISIPSKEADCLVDELLKEGCKRYIEIVSELEKLSNEEFEELCAVMWLGRGDDESLSLAEWRAHASGQNRDYAASKAPLAKYLRDGLAKLGSV